MGSRPAISLMLLCVSFLLLSLSPLAAQSSSGSMTEDLDFGDIESAAGGGDGLWSDESTELPSAIAPAPYLPSPDFPVGPSLADPGWGMGIEGTIVEIYVAPDGTLVLVYEMPPCICWPHSGAIAEESWTGESWWGEPWPPNPLDPSVEAPWAWGGDRMPERYLPGGSVPDDDAWEEGFPETDPSDGYGASPAASWEDESDEGAAWWESASQRVLGDGPMPEAWLPTVESSFATVQSLESGLESPLELAGTSAATVATSCVSTEEADRALRWAADEAPRVRNPNNGRLGPEAWDGWCLGYVARAWRLGAGHDVPELAAGSARESLTRFRGAGKLETNLSEIPKGAPIFWDCGADGHVALATGERDARGEPIVLSTWIGGSHRGIFRLPLCDFTAYVGRPVGWGRIEGSALSLRASAQ